jgi:hypothetical protein
MKSRRKKNNSDTILQKQRIRKKEAKTGFFTNTTKIAENKPKLQNR